MMQLQEYEREHAQTLRRLGAECAVLLKRNGDFPLKEAGEIEKQIPSDAYLVTLCVEGRQITSEEMAELIAQRANSGKPKLCFVIGGSYGTANCIKNKADFRLSMSKMTFPHHLARVILAEQLYRGYKIREGSCYHK